MSSDPYQPPGSRLEVVQVAVPLPSEGKLFRTWIVVILVGGLAGGIVGVLIGMIGAVVAKMTGNSMSIAMLRGTVIVTSLAIGYATFRYFIRRLIIQLASGK